MAGTVGDLLHMCITYIVSFTALNSLGVMITPNLKMKNLRFRETKLTKAIQQFSGGVKS